MILYRLHSALVLFCQILFFLLFHVPEQRTFQFHLSFVMIARRVSKVKTLRTEIGFQTVALSSLCDWLVKPWSDWLWALSSKHKFENRPDCELLFYIGDKIDSFGHQRVSWKLEWKPWYYFLILGISKRNCEFDERDWQMEDMVWFWLEVTPEQSRSNQFFVLRRTLLSFCPIRKESPG